jgi:hypothetical protein
MGHLRILLPNQLAIERLITLCRVKRHLQTTSNQKHGRPAKAEPDLTICAQGVKVGSTLLDPKLCSKVL